MFKRLTNLLDESRKSKALRPKKLRRRAADSIFKRIQGSQSHSTKRTNVANKKLTRKPLQLDVPTTTVENSYKGTRGKVPNNDRLETPHERVKSLQDKPKQSRKTLDIYDVGKTERHPLIKALRWQNPGDEKLLLAAQALKNGETLPSWARMFEGELRLFGGRKLALGNRRILLQAEKHKLVKNCYFNPKLPSTPREIYHKYDPVIANLTRKDCEKILRTIETYQLNFRRRLPPKVTGRFNVKKQGTIMFDCFFPSSINGWKGRRTVLTCQDYWSKYCGVYCLATKDAKNVQQCALHFFKAFIRDSQGLMPRRVWMDKGTELKGIPELMEKFRLKRDGDAPMVINTRTAGPVHPIEAFNSLVARRMQIFGTKGIIVEPERLCEAITYQLNREHKRDRGNLTPMQLVSLTGMDRQEINKNYKDRAILETSNMKTISVGDRVRYLLLSRKEQAGGSSIDPKTKGFAPKWSRTVHTVLRKLPLRNNRSHHGYYLDNLKEYRLRHELLLIPDKLDSVHPTDVPHTKPKLWESRTADTSEFKPSQEDLRQLEEDDEFFFS